MPEKRCANGHLIEASWDLCPYCPSDRSTGEIPVVRPRPAEEARNAWGPERTPGSRVEVPSIPRTSPQINPAPVSRTVAVPKADLGITTQPRLVVGWLVGLNGAIRGESFPVRIGKTSIGRDPRSDVIIFDEQTSAHHADLVYRPEERRFILMDHNSTNGTYVNDTEIEPRRDLAHHDIMRIGSQRFLFIKLDFNWDDPRAER